MVKHPSPRKNPVIVPIKVARSTPCRHLTLLTP